MPLLGAIRGGGTYRVLGDGAVAARWSAGTEGVLMLDANLSGGIARGFPADAGRVIWLEGRVADDGAFAPFTVRWSMAAGGDV